MILGFGRQVTWTSDLVVPPGHQMTFKDALHILSTNLIMKILLPSWTKNLTKHSRKVEQAFIELKVRYSCCSCVIDVPRFKQQYMLEMVEARRTSSEAEQRYDLFSGLLNASQDDLDKESALNDDELMGKYSNFAPLCIPESVLPAILGNMFIFLLAGHEVGTIPLLKPHGS